MKSSSASVRASHGAMSSRATREANDAGGGERERDVVDIAGGDDGARGVERVMSRRRRATAVGRMGTFGWDVRLRAARDVRDASAFDRAGVTEYALAHARTRVVDAAEAAEGRGSAGTRLRALALDDERACIVVSACARGVTYTPGASARGRGVTMRASCTRAMTGGAAMVDSRRFCARGADVASASSRGVALERVEIDAHDNGEMMFSDALVNDTVRGVLEVRVHPMGDRECAFALDSGELGTLNRDGARVFRSPAMGGDGAWYGVAYGVHPRVLLHGCEHAVYSVDLRASRRESRMLHDVVASPAERWRAMSNANENYYAMASSSTKARVGSYVEIRDMRRASEPVLRWNHRGLSAPTSIELVDTTAWHSSVKATRALGVRAYSSSESEVYLYESAKYLKGQIAYASAQMIALSPGVVGKFDASPLQGFDMLKMKHQNALLWMNDQGVHLQQYACAPKSGDHAHRLSALFFESPQPCAERVERRSQLTEPPPNEKKTRITRPARDRFVDVPFVYDFVVHGRPPLGDYESSQKPTHGDHLAYLHGKLSDGWAMNWSEVLDSAELLSSSTTPVTLALREWRESLKVSAQKQPARARAWRRRAKIDDIPNPLETFVEKDDIRQWASRLESKPEILDAINDHMLADDESCAYTRRLYHAARCIDAEQSARTGVSAPPAMLPKAHAVAKKKRVRDRQSLPQLSDSELDESHHAIIGTQSVTYVDSLRADWVPVSTSRRRESVDLSMPPPAMRRIG